MSRNESPINSFVAGVIGLFVVIFSIFAIKSCATSPGGDLSKNSSLNNNDNSITSSSSSSINVSNNASSNSSSNSTDVDLPSVEEPAEEKKREFKLNNLTKEMIHDLFERIFKELPNTATPSIEYESSNILVYKYLTFSCPICEDTEFFTANLYTNGVLVFENVFPNKEHMPKKLEIDLADVFLNYLKKDTAVLIGKNYQYDFGIIKKVDKWYFEFLGLNLPLYQGEIDIRTETLLEAFGNTLIEGKLDKKGYGYDLSKENLTDEDLKNAIPLLFYKHFGNVLVEYNAIDASQVILDEAEADATANKFNEAYLNPLKTINENIAELNSDLKNNYILGNFKSSELVTTTYGSYQEVIDYCFASMFKETYPDFVESNDLEFNENGMLIADNGSASEGVVNVIATYNGFPTPNSPFFPFFPFFNSWSLFPSSDVGGSGTQYYANEIGRIACLGMINFNKPDYFEDEHSHKTNHSDYFFEWGITDAYYFILDYMVSNCYLKEAKLLYANTYNDLTKTTSTIDEFVLVKETISEDLAEDSLTTLYGVVDKNKLLNGEVVKMGFEVKMNNNITTYLTTNYTTSVVINNTTYNDPNSCYFYYVMNYQETAFETRFFVEYNDRIEYSKWR